MPYDRTRHQELLAKLDAGLAKVSGPQCYNADTSTSDGAFDALLRQIVNTIDTLLSYGHNSAMFEVPLVTSNIILAGRVIAALEDQGFTATVYATHRDSVSYLTFEAVLLPLKEEAEAVVVEAPVESEPAPVEGVTNDITPGTVVKVASPKGSLRAEQVRHALRALGYDVIVDVFHLTNCAIPVLGHLEGAPEAERIKRLLIGMFGAARTDIFDPTRGTSPYAYCIHIND